jgi:hypothetical protein
MRIFIFKTGSNVYGFTPEESGSNLPGDRGPWAMFKSIEILEDDAAPRGVHDADILAGIKAKGFYLTDEWTP